MLGMMVYAILAPPAYTHAEAVPSLTVCSCCRSMWYWPSATQHSSTTTKQHGVLVLYWQLVEHVCAPAHGRMVGAHPLPPVLVVHTMHTCREY
jgi:hypothetical protein